MTKPTTTPMPARAFSKVSGVDEIVERETKILKRKCTLISSNSMFARGCRLLMVLYSADTKTMWESRWVMYRDGYYASSGMITVKPKGSTAKPYSYAPLPRLDAPIKLAALPSHDEPDGDTLTPVAEVLAAGELTSPPLLDPHLIEDDNSITDVVAAAKLTSSDYADYLDNDDGNDGSKTLERLGIEPPEIPGWLRPL